MSVTDAIARAYRARQVAAAKHRRKRPRTSPLYFAAKEFFEDHDNRDLLIEYSFKAALERFEDSDGLLKRYTYESSRRVFFRARKDVSGRQPERDRVLSQNKQRQEGYP